MFIFRCAFISLRFSSLVVRGRVAMFFVCFFTLHMLMWNLLSPGKEVRVEVVEDPCKCEARLVFQKQTQAAIQQLTAKNILFLLFQMEDFIINIPCSTFHCGQSCLFQPAGVWFKSVSCVFDLSFCFLEFPWLAPLADVSGRIERLENMVGRAWSSTQW